jgi:predicted ATP-grasp superfamily ATP-dependent carboligase
VDTKNRLPYAFIIGLDCITGLQSARILARHGIPVIGLVKDLDHFCCRTKMVEKILKANTASEEFIELLEKMGPTLEQKAVLFPCTDMSVLTLSRNRQRLEKWYHIALPKAEVVEMLMDKVSFYTYAEKEGLAIPRTFFLRSRSDAEAAAGELTYPCIMKPPMKTPTWEKNTKAKVYKVASRGEFIELYDRCSGWADLLMVQEWIEGNDADLYSCNCYFDANSQPLVTFIARKIRQWPIETGTSCLGEECRNDAVLEESLRLFHSVNYHGLGYVEMKRDQRSGKHYIIEPNIGRPTGRSAIAETGDVELLYTKYCDLLGLPLPQNRVQKYQGVKWMYLRHDIQSALYYWWRGKLTIRDWWRSVRGRKMDAVFAWNDQAPFWYDLWGFTGTLLRAFSRKLVPQKQQKEGDLAYSVERRAS